MPYYGRYKLRDQPKKGKMTIKMLLHLIVIFLCAINLLIKKLIFKKYKNILINTNIHFLNRIKAGIYYK